MSLPETRRVAGIDVGSNSFLLLVLEVGPEGEQTILDRTDIVGLGDGVDQQRRLDPAAADRAAAQLAEYAGCCRDLGVEAVGAVGTAALREAADSAAFCQRIETATGIAIEVISGEREAELTYADVARTHGRPGEPLILIDVGGGSSEVVAGADGVIASRVSIPIGSRRLAERVDLDDGPLTPQQRADLILGAAAPVATVMPLAGTLVGTGGTITTIAACWHQMTTYDSDLIATTRLTRSELAGQLEWLSGLDLASRGEVPGLEPKRARTIVPGLAIIIELMRRLGATELGVHPGGLRFAVAREVLARLRHG